MPGLADIATLSTASMATTFSAGGVPDGLYFLRVRAMNATGFSGPSNEIELQVGAPPPLIPGPPSGLTAVSAGSSITLSWVAPTSGGSPSSYTIEAGSTPGSKNLAMLATGTAAMTYTTGGVANGSYYVRVRAVNAAGTSTPSNEALLIVGCTASPGGPANFRVTGKSGGNVSFAWDAPAGPPNNAPTTYVLEAGSTPGASNLATLDLGSPATTFTTGGVGPGTYYVRVRATNKCGHGSASNEVVLIVQ